jgi:AcrR family transcriptional regulator
MPKVVPEYKEEAKERIVQVALQVYSEKGYHEATMEDVAQRLGVSKGALYLYFRSKDELLKAITEKWYHGIGNILSSSLESKEQSKSIESLFDHIAKEPRNSMGLGFDLISEASRNPSIRKILSEEYENILEILIEFLGKPNIRGSPQDAANTRSLSISLIALLFGLMSSLILGTDKTDARKAWEQSVKAITKAYL